MAISCFNISAIIYSKIDEPCAQVRSGLPNFIQANSSAVLPDCVFARQALFAVDSHKLIVLEEATLIVEVMERTLQLPPDRTDILRGFHQRTTSARQDWL